MRTYGTPGPDKAPVIFQAQTSCDCGCGRKDRFIFQVGRDAVVIDDPEMIRALIVEMAEGFERLFPGRSPLAMHRTPTDGEATPRTPLPGQEQ